METESDGTTQSAEDAMQIPDQDKLNAFLGRMVGDLGSVATGVRSSKPAVCMAATRATAPILRSRS